MSVDLTTTATDCRGDPLDFDTLDPGIRDLVRALLAAGFQTCDSGDGRHKATTGEYEDGSYSDLPHVVIRPSGDLKEEGCMLVEMLMAMGAEDFTVQAEFFLGPDGPDVALLVGGDGLYGLGSSLPANRETA